MNGEGRRAQRRPKRKKTVRPDGGLKRYRKEETKQKRRGVNTECRD